MEGKDDLTGRFVAGNKFWHARSSCGVAPKFETAEQLWSACAEYFDWSEENPLFEAKPMVVDKAVVLQPVPKMRAMTLSAMCMFLDVSFETWCQWRAHRPDLAPAIQRAEAVIYRQKFEGAAAELLNPAIIARDLGLADRKEHTGANGGPIQTEDVTRDAADFASRMGSLAARAAGGGTEPAA